MRLLSIGNMYPPHVLGGAELVWQSWVEHARDAGHDVRVLTTDVQIAGAEGVEEPGVERTLRWYWEDFAFPRMSPLERLRIERHNARTLDAALGGVDAVVWWAMAGMSFGLVERVRRRGLPAVAVLGDYWLTYGPDVDGWMKMFKARPRLGRAVERLTGLPTRAHLDRGMDYVFVSETVRDQARAHLPAMTGYEVAHHGPDLDRFAFHEPRRPWSGRLLVLGRLDERKGVAIAIEALTHLPGATLSVVGSGDDSHLADLRRLTREQGLEDRVEFAGRRPREALAQVMADHDALLFPVTWREPWGLVPSEAMAAGLPVVGSGRGGAGEYMREGVNALVFDPDDGPRALARRVEELAADPDLRARLVRGGRATAEALSAESFDAAVTAAVARVVGAAG